MMQEDKELLLKDLSARLPYGVKCQWGTYYKGTLIDVCKCKTTDGFVYWDCYFEEWEDDVPIEIVKPYLRPMSSMTEEEDKEWQYYKNTIAESCDERLEERISELHDWFNAHHFDFRNLIERGLAIDCTGLNIY